MGAARQCEIEFENENESFLDEKFANGKYFRRNYFGAKTPLKIDSDEKMMIHLREHSNVFKDMIEPTEEMKNFQMNKWLQG